MIKRLIVALAVALSVLASSGVDLSVAKAETNYLGEEIRNQLIVRVYTERCAPLKGVTPAPKMTWSGNGMRTMFVRPFTKKRVTPKRVLYTYQRMNLPSLIDINIEPMCYINKKVRFRGPHVVRFPDSKSKVVRIIELYDATTFGNDVVYNPVPA